MFAVPGWSVTADTLKPQSLFKAPKVSDVDVSDKVNHTEKKSRKRKRGHGSDKDVVVTEENLGEFWRKHIERKTSKSTQHVVDGIEAATDKKQQKKKSKIEKNAVPGSTDGLDEDIGKIPTDHEERNQGQEAEVQRKKKTKREEKQEKPTNQINSNEQVENDIVDTGKDTEPSKDGKSKYEERKAKAARKRERKKQLQANGTLPPDRPNPMPQSLAEAPASKQSGNSETSANVAPAEVPAMQVAPSAKVTLKPRSAKIPDPPTASTANLTPLQQRMAAKLTSARFRHLNQTLYTTPSDQAMQLFTESPQAYTSYHAGFRAQVAVWPQNPVHGFIEDIKARGSVSIPSQKNMWRDQKKGKKSKGGSNGDVASQFIETPRVDPLPRPKHGHCTIADLGCGDATLASSLTPSKKSLNLNLLSFDLSRGDTPNAHLITVADITNLRAVGVRNESVDIAVCCLSLMGTNWVNVVDELKRVVRAGGEVWVAEIKSRFARPDQEAKKKQGDGIGKKKKKPKADDDDVDEPPPDLVEVEEEGALTGKDETDVSAFVDVFRKRGFNLKGEPDMTNKMFVKMRFVKAQRVDKGLWNEKGGAAKFGDGFKGKQRATTRFIDGDDGVEMDEGKVLKPCVYKTR